MNKELEFLPPSIRTLAEEALDNVLPAKSEQIYKKVYAEFRAWMHQHNVFHITEVILLAYMAHLARTLNAHTLWSRFSMIARMAFEETGQNLKSYTRVKAFLKKNSTNVETKKAAVFSPAQIQEFLNDADNSVYLATKVCT